MKHAAWFRLVLKGIGVVLIALALGQFLTDAARYTMDARQERRLAMQGLAFGQSDLRRDFLIKSAPHLAQLAIGSYLLLGGRFVVNVCIPPNRRYCPECSYDLSKSGSPTACSECGAALEPSASADAGSVDRGS